MLSKHLIYGLVDPRNGEIRYVGQSSSGLRRPRQHGMPHALSRETPSYKSNWIKQLHGLGLKYQIKVLEEFVSADDMKNMESFWILQLRSLGTRLTNLTDGGEGLCGYVVSEATRRKLSEGRLGEKHWLYGTHLTQEQRCARAISLGARPIVDSNGVSYSSVAEAAIRTGLGKTNIRHVVKGRTLTAGGLKFKYLDEGSTKNG